MKQTDKEIKTSAKEYFEKGNYNLAFETLWKLGTDNFVSYAQKENKKSKTNWFTEIGRASCRERV